jgi:hypothetical protein
MGSLSSTTTDVGKGYVSDPMLAACNLQAAAEVGSPWFQKPGWLVIIFICFSLCIYICFNCITNFMGYNMDITRRP